MLILLKLGKNSVNIEKFQILIQTSDNSNLEKSVYTL